MQLPLTRQTSRSGLTGVVLITVLVLLPACRLASQPTSLPDAGQTQTSTLTATVASAPTATPTPASSSTPAPTPATTPTALAAPAQTSPPCPVVLFARDRYLWRSNVDGNAVEQLTRETRLPWQPGEGDWWMAFLSRPIQLSPDGRWITFLPQYERFLFDVTTHTRVRISGRGAPVVGWSPDSRYLAYPGRRGNDAVLYHYDIQQGQTTELLRLPLSSEADPGITNVVWSLDGRLIGFACCYTTSTDTYPSATVGQVRQIEVSTGRVETTGETHRLYVATGEPVCWAAQGRLTTDRSQGIRCSEHSPFLLIAPTSLDGALRASVGPASSDDIEWTGASLLTVSEVATEEVQWEREIEWRVRALSWSPDGQYLFFDDDLDRSPIWRIQSDGSVDPETVIEDGFLLGVIPQWCQPLASEENHRSGFQEIQDAHAVTLE